MNRWKSDTWILLALMVVPTLFFIIFSFWPLYGVIMAFQNFSPVKGILKSPFVGFDNFTRIFRMPEFLRALRNTLAINGLKITFSFSLSIIFALMLNELRSLPFKRTTQTISYLPYFVSWVVASGLWYKLLSIDNGPLNNMLQSIGLTNEPIHFIAQKALFYPILIFTDLWKNLGWNAIIYLAALSSVDPELYEAAQVDGATRFWQAWHISLPCIRPTIVMMFILTVSGLMNADFDQIYTMINPAVREVGDVLDTMILRTLQTGGLSDYSYGIAAGLFKNMIGFALFMLANKISNALNQETLI